MLYEEVFILAGLIIASLYYSLFSIAVKPFAFGTKYQQLEIQVKCYRLPFFLANAVFVIPDIAT